MSESNLPERRENDPAAIVKRRINELRATPNSWNELADMDATLLQHHAAARNAGDEEKAKSLMDLLNHLDIVVSEVAHQYSAALTRGERGLEAKRDFIGDLMNAAREVGARHGWSAAEIRLSTLRDVALRHPARDHENAWGDFLEFAENYQRPELPAPEDFQSEHARAFLPRIEAANNFQDLDAVLGEIFALVDMDERLIGDGDAELLFRAMRVKASLLLQLGYERGRAVEGIEGAAEGIHAVITPDPTKRIGQPNPVFAQAERLARMLDEERLEQGAAPEDAGNPDDDAAPVQVRLPHAERLQVAAEHAATRPAAAASFPEDEVTPHHALEMLFRNTALGRTLLVGMGYDRMEVDARVKQSLEKVIMDLTQSRRPPTP